MPNSWKTRFNSLSNDRKIVLIGAALGFVSVFLPWYKDIDQFNTGDVFLGISGPLYITGLFVMLASMASFGLILMKMLQKPQPNLPVSNKQFHIFAASVSILMLVIAISVYFHPKFGINLTEKSAGIGLYAAFVGMGMVLAGGMLREKDMLETHSDHLVAFDDQREAASLKSEPDDVKTEIAESLGEYTNNVTDQY